MQKKEIVFEWIEGEDREVEKKIILTAEEEGEGLKLTIDRCLPMIICIMCLTLGSCDLIEA